MIGAFSRWLVFAPTNFQAAQDSGALTTTPGSSAGGLSDGSGSKSVPKQNPNYLYISDEGRRCSFHKCLLNCSLWKPLRLPLAQPNAIMSSLPLWDSSMKMTWSSGGENLGGHVSPSGHLATWKSLMTFSSSINPKGPLGTSSSSCLWKVVGTKTLFR